MDIIGIKLACLYQFFYFGNGNFTCHGHYRVKVSAGRTEYQISGSIAFPGFHNGKISIESIFHQVIFAVKIADFLTFGYLGTHARWRKNCRHAISGR
ncbi:hypothetical protein D3C73_1374910 [compost metagenome]